MVCGAGTAAITGPGNITYLEVGEGIGIAVDEATGAVVLLVGEYTGDVTVAVLEGEYTGDVAVAVLEGEYTGDVAVGRKRSQWSHVYIHTRNAQLLHSPNTVTVIVTFATLVVGVGLGSKLSKVY